MCLVVLALEPFPWVGLPGQSGRVILDQSNMGGAFPERLNLPCQCLEGPFVF